MNQGSDTVNPNPTVNSRNYQKLFQSATFPLFIALVVYIVIIAVIESAFISAYNIRNVLQQVSVLGILTVGATMVIITGEFDLSVGNLLSLISCIMAWFLVKDVNPFLVGVIGIIFCIGTQLLIGLIISRFRVASFIITLGMMHVYRGFALLTTNGSEIPIGGRFEAMGRSTILSVPTPVYFFISVCIVFFLLFRYTRFGRRLFAVGENKIAAFLAGIDVKNYKLAVFGINGLLAGLAALILLSRVGVGNPNIGNGLELEAIAAAVVGGTALSGGKGSIVGSFIGVIFLGIISNSLNIVGVSTFWKYVTTGSVIIIAVVISNVRKTA